MHFLLKLFSAFHIDDSFSASSEVQMYVPFPSTLKPNLLLAACMYAALFLNADAFIILSLVFNYFPLLISTSFNPSFAFASSFNFPEVNNAHEDLEFHMFQVKYLFLLALVFLCFILPLIKIGGGGESRTHVLKSPQEDLSLIKTLHPRYI